MHQKNILITFILYSKVLGKCKWWRNTLWYEHYLFTLFACSSNKHFHPLQKLGFLQKLHLTKYITLFSVYLKSKLCKTINDVTFAKQIVKVHRFSISIWMFSLGADIYTLKKLGGRKKHRSIHYARVGAFILNPNDFFHVRVYVPGRICYGKLRAEGNRS